MKKTLLLVLALILIFSMNVADAQITSQAVDQLVEEAIEKFDVVGVSVGIVKDGKIIHANTSVGGGAVFDTVSQTILDSYLELDDFGWMEKVAAGMEQQLAAGDQVTEDTWKTVEAANDDHLKSDDFIGVFEDPWFGKVEVYSKEEQLWIKSHRSPKLTGPMRFYKANAFAIHWEYQDMNADAFAIFSLDEEGKAQSIKMKGISPNIDFSFDFQDLDLRRVEK